MISNEDIQQLMALERAYVTGKNIISDNDYEAFFIHIMNKYNVIDRNVIVAKMRENAIMKHAGYVSHITFVKSIRKFYNGSDILKHIIRNNDVENIIVEPKIDGIMISLIFLDGVLIKCLTRGNKYSGEDITDIVKYVVKNMKHFKAHTLYEITGELFIQRSVYMSRYNRFKTARHALIALITNTNSNEEDYNALRFFVHGCGVHMYEQFVDYTQFYNFVVNINNIGENIYKVINVNNIEYELENIYTVFSNYDFCIDGLIFKRIKFDTKLYNKYKEFNDSIVAYKRTISMCTSILKIYYTYAKSGNVIPQIIIEPVEYNGIKCSKINLYSYSFIFKRQIGVGDKINVVFGGIFVFESVVESANNFVALSICEHCRCRLYEHGLHLKCVNYNCKDKLKKNILYFCKCLRIVGISSSTINALVDNEVIKNIIDFFELKAQYNTIVNIERFGEKKVNNILSSIEYIKQHITNIHIINILPIDSIGNKCALKLADILFDYNFNINVDDCVFLNKLQKQQLKLFLENNDNKELILYFSNLKK